MVKRCGRAGVGEKYCVPPVSSPHSPTSVRMQLRQPPDIGPFQRQCGIPMASSIHCTRSARALRATFGTGRTNDATLPAFLVPALAHPPPTQRSHFSTTRPQRSKIGKLPLSLPPEVSFDIIAPPPVKQGGGISRNEPSSRVEITGPLGKLGVEIPPYMSIDVDEAARTRSLSILDSTDKKQKAMWGAFGTNGYGRETRD